MLFDGDSPTRNAQIMPGVRNRQGAPRTGGDLPIGRLFGVLIHVFDKQGLREVVGSDLTARSLQELFAHGVIELPFVHRVPAIAVSVGITAGQNFGSHVTKVYSVRIDVLARGSRPTATFFCFPLLGPLLHNGLDDSQNVGGRYTHFASPSTIKADLPLSVYSILGCARCSTTTTGSSPVARMSESMVSNPSPVLP